MGAWSEETFGNDTACDWIYGFLEEPGMAKVNQNLEVVLGEDDYVDSDAACEALAACEYGKRTYGSLKMQRSREW